MGDRFDRMIMLDTETSGTDPKRCQVLTLDATYLYRFGSEWVASGEPFHAPLAFIPGMKVEPQALAVNNIDPATWKGGTEAETVAALVSWVQNQAKSSYILMAGYNISFDRAFLEAMFDRCRVRWTDAFSYRDLDVRQLVHWMKLLGHVETDRMTLVCVADELGLPTAAAHNSAADVAMTISVMNLLLGKLAQSELF